MLDVEVPEADDVRLFVRALQGEATELLTDRYYLRTAIAVQLGGEEDGPPPRVLRLFRWILSECSQR